MFNIKICSRNVSILIDIRNKQPSDDWRYFVFSLFFSHFSQFLAKDDVHGPDDEVKSIQYHTREELCVNSN